MLKKKGFIRFMCTNQSTTKAILVVSFGTSYHDTREKTIDCIEQDIAQTFPHHHIYRVMVYTSITYEKPWNACSVTALPM